jgi:hypothetical protein
MRLVVVNMLLDFKILNYEFGIEINDSKLLVWNWIIGHNLGP